VLLSILENARFAELHQIGQKPIVLLQDLKANLNDHADLT
jgi:hypothetical protein